MARAIAPDGARYSRVPAESDPCEVESNRGSRTLTRRMQWAAASALAVVAVAALPMAAPAAVLRDVLGPNAAVWIGAAVGLAIVLFSLIVLSVWNRTLRSQVEKRTEALQRELAERQRVE